MVTHAGPGGYPRAPPGRAVIDREIIHIEDMAPLVATEYPEVAETNRRVGGRTVRPRVSIETVRRWIKSGDLAAFAAGGRRGGYRIRRDDLEAFIERRMRRSEQEPGQTMALAAV